MLKGADNQQRPADLYFLDANSRLEAILAAAEIGTWTWDIVNDRITGDRNLSLFFSVPAVEGGSPYAEFSKSLHPQDQAHADEVLRRSMANPGAGYECDYRVLYPDGSVRWITARGGYKCEAGRPVFLAGVLIDITGRKQAESERDSLLERERAARSQADALNARLNFSLSSLELGDWIWDAATDDIVLSDRTADILGVQPGLSITREALRACIHDEDRDLARAAARHAAATRSDYIIEYRVNHPSRGLRWVAARGRPVCGPDGSVVTMMGVVQDITERRAQEQSVIELSANLRAQTEHFETTLSNLNDFVYSFDRAGRVTYANRSLLKLWNQPSLKETVGKSFLELGYPEDLAARHMAEIAQVFRTRKAYIGETPYLTPSGEWVFFQYIFSPVFDEHGEVIAIAGTTRDTTERKANELALAAAREELQHHAETLASTVAERTARLQETIGELEAFSYSVSHDMRAPLRAMQGYADALLEDYEPKLDETAVRHLTRIRKNAERLELLVRDILTYSRVAKEEIKLNPLPLQPFLENLLPQLPNLQPPLARIRIHGPLPDVVAHEAYLSQIFTNLLGNAVKFVPPGVIPVIEITAKAEGEFVKVGLRDNGIGIAPEHFDRIFNIFGRVYPENKFDGTGIGLSIVKKAVQRMGGLCGVESALGQGSLFWFTLRKS